jgi:hypothetical protein
MVDLLPAGQTKELIRMLCRASVVVALGLGFLLLPLVGCGGSSGNRVSGKVTFKGQPVPAGKVMIAPDVAKGNSGETGYADIKDGAYDTSAEGGKGAVKGAVVISINGFDPTPPPGAGPDVTSTQLFNNYQKPVDLPDGASVQDIDVPAEAANAPVETGERTVVSP